ncbi:DUF4091 domain-containing protein [Helcococcus ovis]|uniref:DUF4091 domain-containing protein n=2 Tax=Helcococcus ovis TaxID=72026 RepID=A0A4R9C2K4_9FIRM|nr:DUF4091 domain-containing protein [Helcococcus ovis]TFF64560.1 DUF4091 domain-containing protein [Helcococcus ovis]TFF64640.1 DUF4091 domain-containing protein [Helcococcus ovis]
MKLKIVDSNLKYDNITLKEFELIEDVLTYKRWKNDILILHFLVYSEKDDQYDIDLSFENPLKYKIYKVQKNLAYEGDPTYPISLNKKKNRAVASDILIEDNKASVKAGNFQSFYAEINIPYDIDSEFVFKVKLYNSQITEYISKKVCVKISHRYIDFNKYKFDLELWQYPYSVAEYYGVKPFSHEHFKILEKHMKLYYDLGGRAITATLCEDAWGGQTYSKNEIKYPSMIKWYKEGEKFRFDYTNFDKWVEFCQGLNLGKEKIIIYGMAPWHESFTYYSNEELIFEKYMLDSQRYCTVWREFLSDFYIHLEEKKWFDMIYIGIDERGFSKEIFEVLSSVKNSKSNTIKISASIDNYSENAKYLENVQQVSVSMIEFEKDRLRYHNFVEDRRRKGFDTYLYSCVGHRPGNFVLSENAETYYTVVSSSLCDGFLRWAYDAWTQNPIEDSTHSSFEPGDCFLVYPSNDNDKNTNISLRYLKIKEGIYDSYKIKRIEERNKDLLDQIFSRIKTKFIFGKKYLSKIEIEILLNDISIIKSMF